LGTEWAAASICISYPARAILWTTLIVTEYMSWFIR
jgi:hypothetical protein